MKTIKEIINEGIGELQWLNGKRSDFTEDEISDIEADLKECFESQYYSSKRVNYCGDEFDDWYDIFCEDIIHPYLLSQTTINNDVNVKGCYAIVEKDYANEKNENIYIFESEEMAKAYFKTLVKFQKETSYLFDKGTCTTAIISETDNSLQAHDTVNKYAIVDIRVVFKPFLDCLLP